MKRFPFILALLFTFSLQSIGQNLFLTGIVKNAQSGETLPSASIVIKGTSTGTTTNVDGFFTLLNLPGKKFTLNAFYVGCHPFEMEVDLDKLKGRLEIIMQPSNIEIDEVFVTAKAYKMIKATEGVSITHRFENLTKFWTGGCFSLFTIVARN